MAERQFKAVLFDLGSTLIYFEGSWDEVMAESDRALLPALRADGYRLDEATFLPVISARFEAYYTERDVEYTEYTTECILRDTLIEFGYPDPPQEHLRRALAAKYEVTETHWKIEADALDTLRTLREQGYRLGILSNAGDDQNVQNLVDQTGLRPFFDLVATSAAVGERKPAPRLFNLALERWGFPPSQVVMVGDTLDADILGGRQAGLTSVWITRRVSPTEPSTRTASIQPDAVIAALSELPVLLEQWNQKAARAHAHP